jgi:hypothetical protein
MSAEGKPNLSPIEGPVKAPDFPPNLRNPFKEP